MLKWTKKKSIIIALGDAMQEMINIESAFSRFDYISKCFIESLKEDFNYGKETRKADEKITRLQQTEIESNHF